MQNSVLNEYEGNTSNTSNDSTFLFNFSSVQKKPLRKKMKRSSEKNNARPEADLLPVSVLSDSVRSIFPFKFFNRMQTDAFESIYKSNENCIISSPTGSGKTVLFELAIAKCLSSLKESSQLKALYIAPTKSLCNEKYQQWKNKFLDISVGMLTSDTSFTEVEKVKASNIIICTPEKWDVITRKWTDYSAFFNILRLVLVDEIHTIQEQRGSTLEVVLTRMNKMCNNLRIIGVSATIPNINDIAEWLKTGGPDGKPANALIFDESYRQVELKTHVFPFTNKFNNEFQLDALFNTKVIELINQYSKGKPVLIFCATRQSTITTAKYIAQHQHELNKAPNRREFTSTQDRQLNEVLKFGVGFHHAGLSMLDRSLVEDKFANGNIHILCSTSTLAMGVNLPAYLVIIKGTNMWSMNGAQEYSTLDILQMIGRAGRPQFETKGCALILTDDSSHDKYENLLKGTAMLESSLHLNLAEHIVAEIMLQTITSLSSAIAWLRNTFFYTRYTKNPSHYNLTKNRTINDPESQLLLLCEQTLRDLTDYQIVNHENGTLSATGYGQALTRHYILLDTVKNIIRSTNGMKLHQVLSILANASEFDNIRLKHNEKKLYKEININPLIRFPFVDQKKQFVSISSREQKISLIIQYELSGSEFPSYKDAAKHHQTLSQDKILVFRHCNRVLKCMIDCFIERNDGESLKQTLFLLRSINGKGWEDTPMILRQLNNIGLVSVRKLVTHGVCSFNEMKALSAQQIEYFLGMRPGNGFKILKDLELIPEISLRYTLENKSESNSFFTIAFKVEVSATFKSAIWHGQQLCLLVMLKTDDGVLIDFRRTFLAKLKTPKSFRININVRNTTKWIEFLYSCEQIGGLYREERYYLNENASSTNITNSRVSDISSALINKPKILNELS